MKHLITTGKLLFWLAVCQLPGLIGVGIVRDNLAWYHTLTFPPFTPPDAAFGLAWSLLYILLGIAAFLTFKNKIQTALTPFLIQLALNAAWTPLFFGAHQKGAALLLLLAMLGQSVWLTRAFYKQSRAAAWLMIPYQVWLLYAFYLSAGTWWLNR